MCKEIQHKSDGKMGEVLRFAIVGVIATLIQYGVYFVLVLWLIPTLAMTIAYAVSFAFNFMSVICKSRTRWYADISEQTTAIFHFIFC